MRLKDIARSHIRQASLRIDTAKRAFLKGEFAYSIRQCQECAELALKGALNFIGVEYPRYHDVSPLLVEKKQAFPEWFRKDIEKFAETSKELSRKREPAMYGEEVKGLPTERLFTREEAKKILEGTEYLCQKARKLITGK